MGELGNYEKINKNMKMEIDYLVGELRQLDAMIDEKNKEVESLRQDLGECEGEVGRLRKEGEVKDGRIAELMCYLN